MRFRYVLSSDGDDRFDYSVCEELAISSASAVHAEVVGRFGRPLAIAEVRRMHPGMPAAGTGLDDFSVCAAEETD